MEGAAHHILGYGGAIDGFLNDLPLYETLEGHFGGKVIVLNAGGVLNPPKSSAYTSRPHRDIRAFSPGYPLSMNMLVMLDDFTEVNGATRLLEGSHLTAEMASDAEFAAGAIQITGRAGDIVLFDSLAVHAAAPNRSTAPRRALTLCFGRPFMKPQMDWPRFLSAAASQALSAKGRQLRGEAAGTAVRAWKGVRYAAQPVGALRFRAPQPPERWTFKADQR